MHSPKALLGSLFLMAASGYKTRFFPESGGLQESIFVRKHTLESEHSTNSKRRFHQWG